MERSIQSPGGVDRDRYEDDPFERIYIRTEGLRAITTLAGLAIEQGNVTDKVWAPLWYFVGKLSDDIAQDAEVLHQDRHAAQQATKHEGST